MTNVLKKSTRTNFDDLNEYELTENVILIYNKSSKSSHIVIPRKLFEDFMGESGEWYYEEIAYDYDGEPYPVIRCALAVDYWQFCHPSQIIEDLKNYLQTL